MNSKTSFATATLSYPIFAAEFDPYNRGYLVVGGGGGESRSGVPNQISVLDVFNRAIILTVAEIELSRDEDSVQSLASLATKDGLITFAGINSSQAEQDDGKNEHFRAFDIKIPARKRLKLDEALNEKGSGRLLGKRALLKPSQAKRKEAYQRILRLSPVKRESGSRRIGAIVSGMSKPAEVVVFDATIALPAESDVLARIRTDKEDDILDLDIAVADQDRFSVAWCTEHDIQEQTYDYDFGKKKVKKTPQGPRKIYEIAAPDVGSKESGRSKFRCIRFLDSQNILALVNLAGKKGAELQIYHLYPTGPASTTFQMRLPFHVKQAVSMDICALDSDNNGNRQILIAVAGQDISISTWIVDYRAATDTFSKFYSYQTVRDVHKHQMTKICFAPFHPPQRTENTKEVPEQFAKLASVSYGNTVVVDSFPLYQADERNPQSRYVLRHPDTHNRQRNIYMFVFAFVALMTAYITQGYLRGAPGVGQQIGHFIRDARKSFLNETSTLIDVGKEMEASAASILESTVPTEVPGKQTLQDLLEQHAGFDKAVVIKDDGEEVKVDVHHDKEEYLASDPHAKHWHELPEEQQSYWKQKLQRAGHWAESEGETVFKGVLWSQWAGLVGEAAGEMLREL